MEEEDFKKIEKMYSRTPLESPSPSVLERLREQARREKKSWWAILWHQPRSVGAFAILLIMVSVGLIYKNELTGIQIKSPPAGHPDTPQAEKELVEAPSEPTGFFAEAQNDSSRVEASKRLSRPRDVTFTPFDVAQGKLPERPIGAEVRNAEFSTETERPAFPRLTMTAPIRRSSESDSFNEDLIMARSLESRGQWKEAEKIYGKIWAKNPPQKKLATILFHWAYVLEMSGRKAQALEKLLDLKKINPSYPGLHEAISRLR